MKTIVQRTFVALAIFSVLLSSGRSVGPVLTFGQTAVEGTLTGVAYFDIALAPQFSGTVGYLNIVADLDLNGNSINDWHVQNVAIPLTAGEFGQYSANFSTTFDWAPVFDIGGPLLATSLDVYSSFTLAPLSAVDLLSMQVTPNVASVIYDIGSLQSAAPGRDGAGSPVPASDLGGESAPEVAQASTLVGRVRHDIPGILQAMNECAPTSAAQSLLWLESRQGLSGLPNQAEIIAQLKRDMNWDNGIIPGNFVPGKLKFIADNNLSLTTVAGGQFNGTGTFDFIKSEIEHGEDVEMRIQYPNGQGHWVTIAGWFDDGVTQELFFKDPLTGGNTIDHYTLDGTLIKNYKYGAGATISFAVGESLIAVPEPGTMAAGFVLLGICVVRFRRCFRRKAA